jgi:alanyl aminopeptidase
MRKSALLCLLLSCTSARPSAKPSESPNAHGSMAQKPRSTWSPVVEAEDRTEDDRKLDAGRKPAALLEFIDLRAGAGYTTELLARAVGPSGVVYAQNPEQFIKTFLKDRWPARLLRPAMKNVVRVDRDFADPLPPEAKNLDAVLINAIYHDTVWLKVDREQMNRRVFEALQPGGAYIVIDSSAKAGTGDQDAKTLHRIDEKLVETEVLRAGFKLDRQSDFLRNPEDARDWNASPGAAGAKRGTSDRFALRFIKPEKAARPTLRLPPGAKPVKMAAQLAIDPSKEVFDGQVTIDLDVAEPLKVLWLNADGLTLQKTEPQARILDGGPDFVGLEFAQPLPPGRSALRIDYQGKLSRIDTDGAFKQEENGRWYVLSHFEPTGARRVYPCFDEPSFKVPWQLTLKIPKELLAFSNTLPESTTEEGALKIVRFAQTPPLPSYLTAFGVGPFEVVEGGKSRSGAAVRIVVTQGKKDWASYSAQSSPKLLGIEEEYFGVPYRYGKLDLIEVPVGTGAMENPGLNTFLQTINLVKPGEETPQFQRRAANVEAHEFAHQWFGDLVTTAWWDDLWLNEAFATWMTPKDIEQFAPQWNAAANRVETRNSAMRADTLLTARRIRQPIESNDDIKTAFDGITYSKGASVISMFEAYVGAEAFRKGVHRYLTTYADGNATAKEFLAAISAEAGKDVAPAFSTFLDQAGVPLVSAKLSCADHKATLALTQERYFAFGEENPPQGQTWQIPVCAKFSVRGKLGRACTLLTEKTGALALPSCPDWVLPNEGETGYYRLLLDPSALAALSKAKLSGNERLGLLDDVVAMERAGKLSAAQMLTFLAPFAADPDRHVVSEALGTVASLRDEQVPEGQQPQYAKLVRELFGKRAHALGLQPKKGEDEETALLRPQLIETVGDQGEDPQLAAGARKLAAAWLEKRAAVSAEMVPAVLLLAAQHGDRAFFEQLRTAARKEQDRTDRQRMLTALGQFRDPALAKEAQALVLANDLDIRETLGILFAQSREPATRESAYAFLKTNFDALLQRAPRDAAANFPGTTRFCDDAHFADLRDFFTGREEKITGGPRKLSQALETLRLCAALAKQQSASVGAFLGTLAQKSARVPPRR